MASSQCRKLAHRCVALATVVALGGCQANAVTPPRGFGPQATGAARVSQTQRSSPETVRAAQQRGPGHLYVSGFVGNSPYVQRFPIVNGVPTAPPDLSYSGVVGPIALAPRSHELYAVMYDQLSSVAVFLNGSTQQVRSLNILPPSCYSVTCYVDRPSALLADGRGYLYVGYTYWFSQHGRYGTVYYLHQEVQIYAPDAQGNATPLQRIAIGWCASSRLTPCYAGVYGLAMDKKNDLLVSYYRYTVWFHKYTVYKRVVLTYATPVTKPKRIRKLTGAGVAYPFGLATDASDELYILNEASPGGILNPQNFVAAYPATAKGDRAPDRTITVAGAQSLGYGVAVSNLNLLYVPDPVSNVVYELDSQKGGKEMPISALAVQAPMDVALGP